MIELKGITKEYISKKVPKTIALDNINLSFGNNGLVFIVGKSGSGKSTLLNILGSMDKPTKENEIVIHKYLGQHIVRYGIILWLIVSFILNKVILKSTIRVIVLESIVPISTLIFIVIIALVVTESAISIITKVKPIDAILDK